MNGTAEEEPEDSKVKVEVKPDTVKGEVNSESKEETVEG